MNSITPYSALSKPQEDVCFCLIIQCTNYNQGWLHAGVLYRFDGVWYLGDVAWHEDARRTDPLDAELFFWTFPELSFEDQQQLASKANVWLENNKDKIPYSFASHGSKLFEADTWVANEPGQGLTCSTFVVELFRALGFPFIDVESWEIRPDDPQWQSFMCYMLRTRSGASEEHVNAQLKKIGKVTRVRPSDVIAAGMLLTLDTEEDLKFSEVDPISNIVANRVLNKNITGDSV